jgi:hypothetical protein
MRNVDGDQAAVHPSTVLLLATQISVLLENRPGALGELAGILRQAGVNIEAILLEGSVDFGMVRLHVSATRKAEKALKDAGYQYRVGEALILKLPNEPGQLEDVCRKLAKAKINIDSLYGTTAAGSDEPELVLMVDDVPKAKKALGIAP